MTSVRRALMLAIAALVAVDLAVVAGQSRAESTSAPLGDRYLVELTAQAEAAGRAELARLQPPPTTTTVPPMLSDPIAVPPHDVEPLVVIGEIEIPVLGLRAPLHQGIALSTIDHGPSHWPGTALPGQLGNVVVAGHRVTHTRPFRHIDRLQPGDRVVFTVGGHRFEYEMVRNEVVTPRGLHIIEQTPEYRATLFACHPPGSARYRFVVHLRLVR